MNTTQLITQRNTASENTDITVAIEVPKKGGSQLGKVTVTAARKPAQQMTVSRPLPVLIANVRRTGC